MKFEIRDKKKNTLMKREEVLVSISHMGKATPNRKDVMDEVARLLKTKSENLIVTRITTPGGSTLSEARVYSYSRKEDIPEWRVKRFEARISKIKGGKQEAEKAPEAPAEEPKPGGEAAKEETSSGEKTESPKEAQERPKDEDKPSGKGKEEPKAK